MEVLDKSPTSQAAALLTYSGMLGVKRGSLKGPMVDSANGYIVALRRHRVCSSAGDDGSVIVWIDDDGKFRCQFCRFMATIDEQIFPTKAQVRRWLKMWLPKQWEFHDR